MKVIDLLNKIANGEEVPEKIICNELEYFQVDKDHQYCRNYYDATYVSLISEASLNDEVEVIEENKKIKEIDMFDYFTGYDYGGTNKKLLKDLEHNFETLNSKINEIIDKLNKGE